jgi:hypothetical protein
MLSYIAATGGISGKYQVVAPSSRRGKSIPVGVGDGPGAGADVARVGVLVVNATTSGSAILTPLPALRSTNTSKIGTKYERIPFSLC